MKINRLHNNSNGTGNSQFIGKDETTWSRNVVTSTCSHTSHGGDNWLVYGFILLEFTNRTGYFI